MTIYLDYSGFEGLSALPREYLCELNELHPGWIEQQINYWSRWLDARLRKRYDTPFPAFDAVPTPTPIEVQGWVARMVSWWVLVKRGVDPNDAQASLIKEDADRAMAEVLEASNGETGMFDLPTSETSDASLVSRGGPMTYAEASPYVYRDVQAEAVVAEHQTGAGTTYGRG